MMRAAQFVHRRTGNQMSGQPLVYLTTVGAKSGQRRTVPVMGFRDEGSWLIVASMGGAAGHPAWFYNLAAHPDRVEIEVEGRKSAAAPETLGGAERAAAWERITREQPRFADYETKTDRQIPVVRLTPAG
jgi:deazaflavin-dependent oxidoreductase (nitroreductase family)